MKIFNTASWYGRKKYLKYYNLVLSAIEKTGVELIATEKGNYKEILSGAEKAKLPTERLIHYEAIRRGILSADAVIIEISNEDFQLGHEATLAIQAKKPVLCLSVHEDFSEKINNPYFFAAKYSEYTVEEIIEEFIKRCQKRQLSERFNLFISPNEVQYLEKTAADRKMNKSEYLRSLIDKDQKAK